MTIRQLATFESERGEIVLKLKANWSDGLSTKAKLKVLRSLKKAFEGGVEIVSIAIDKIDSGGKRSAR